MVKKKMNLVEIRGKWFCGVVEMERSRGVVCRKSVRVCGGWCDGDEKCVTRIGKGFVVGDGDSGWVCISYWMVLCMYCVKD